MSIEAQKTQQIQDFRCAFLKYLLEPSEKRQSALIESCIELGNLTCLIAKQKAGSKKIGTDEINEELEPLVQEAIKDICITTAQSEVIQDFRDKLLKNNRNKAFKVDSVLAPAIQTLKDENRVVDNKHQKVFATIYPIELDGHRLKKSWFEASQHAGEAALTLSQKLMQTTLGVCKKDQIEESDARAYAQAYEDAKGHGIEKHRGLKEKFYNFCRALSCVLVVPYFHYSSQPSFWTTAKTTTQEDVDKSHEAIENYQKSFQKQ